MTLFVLVGEDDYGILNTDDGMIKIGSHRAGIPANSVVKAGDEISVKGRKYMVSDLSPCFFEHVSEKGFQTIKIKDASYMISMSSIRSGSMVLESGCGTGSLSVSILWHILPDGILTSVDMSEKAIETARSNIEKFNLQYGWKPILGDIRSIEIDGKFDSVFLDLPDPWESIPGIVKLLRPSGTMITYVPNYNQLERTVICMKKNNLVVLESVEIERRSILVREGMTRPDSASITHTAFITVAMKKSGFTLSL